MTKISQYSTDVNITGNDKWIGSDAQNYLITKNFTPNNLASYFNGNNVIDIGTSIRYTYQTLDPGEAREQGTISFETERGPQVNFSAITTFLIAKNTLKGNTVTQYLDFLVGSKVLLSKANNINTFGYYKVTGIESWIPNTNFLVVTVDFLEGNGFIYEDLDYLVSLVDKSSGSGGTQTLQEVVNAGNGISNFGGIGNASIQSTNFTNNRTLYLNDNLYPTIRLVDNGNASHNLTIDLDTLNIDGVPYNWSTIVSGGTTPTLQEVTDVVPDGNVTTNDLKINQLRLRDDPDNDYGFISLNDSRYTFKSTDGTELAFFEKAAGFAIPNGNPFYGIIIQPIGFTENRNYDLPDADGTIALISDIQILTEGQNINIVSDAIEVAIPPIVNTSATLGSTGNAPFDITIDSLGNIYTANYGSDNVTKITPDGTSTTYGSTESYPTGITIDTLGNIYIANYGSSNVTKIAPDGTSTPYGDTGNGPFSIVIDTLGNIYTANQDSDNVTKITPDGTSTPYGSTGNAPTGITIDSLGNIYTANSGSDNVTKITPDGTSTTLGSTGNAPFDITIDSLGNIYTANYGSDNVTKITPDGTSTPLGTTGLSPQGITIDTLGNVYTANIGSDDITKITPSGVSTTYVSTGNGPFSIVIDLLGNIYTANQNSDNVTKITVDTKRILAVDDNLNIIRVDGSGGGGTQTLAQTLIEGNITDGTDIEISNGDAILLDNGSMLKKGTIDAGNGGEKGISQICSVGYEHKWEAGRLYIMNDGGTTIREVSHNFAVTPTVNDDFTKGFVENSRWILDNGDVYVCYDSTEGEAYWRFLSGIAPEFIFIGDGAGSGNTGNNVIGIGDVAASNNIGNYLTAINGGSENKGDYVNAFGFGAGRNEGDKVNAFGFSALQQNKGDNVNAFGFQAGYQAEGSHCNYFGESAGSLNTFKNVNLFGYSARADAENQTVFSKWISGVTKYLARLSFNNITTDRKWELPDADGTIALTSDIPTYTTPTLQQVTDVVPDGNVTTNDVKVNSLGLYSNSQADYGYLNWDGDTGLVFKNETTQEVFKVDKGGSSLYFVNNDDFTAKLDATLLTENRNFLLPDIEGTIALTSDILPSPLTTKGDLYTFSTVDTRLPLGSNTQILTVDTSTATGLKWAAPPSATPTGYYGAFQDATNQTAAAINTGYPMQLGITDLSNGVTVVSNSRVTIANTGIYNIQWSAQFTNPTANEHDVTIWLRKNGVDVPGSAGVVLVPPKHGSFDGHVLPSWNFLLDPVAGDYYEFVWSTVNTSVYISFNPAGSPPPSTASVVLTVTQQSGIMAGTGITGLGKAGSIQTGSIQTLAVGTSGTDFDIVSSGNTHTFNLPSASATARGLVTVNGQTFAGAKTFSTAPILSSLTASQLLALDGSGNIQSLTIANYPSLTEISYVKGVTSSIQTQLAAKQAALSYTPYKFIQTGITAHTGTVAETIIATATIAGGSFNSTDVMKVMFGANKSSTATACTQRIKINTSNTLTGAVIIAGMNTTTANAVILKRNFVLNGGNLYGVNFSLTNTITDEATVLTNVYNNTPYNTANTLYLFFTVQLGNVADSVIPNLFNITN